MPLVKMTVRQSKDGNWRQMRRDLCGLYIYLHKRLRYCFCRGWAVQVVRVPCAI